jgi:phosphatidylglycerophosphate synthase
MLDRYAAALIKPIANAVGKPLARAGVTADQLTLAGFLIGLLAAYLIASGAYLTGAAAIFLSRSCDALDGAVARYSTPTDRGGFLDIALDFLFYASVPLAFAVADPASNALAAATLLAAFVGTASSFLAFAVIAAKRGMSSTAYPDKSFYFLGGLAEATETLATFAAMCVWPQHFDLLAYAFSVACLITITTRLWWGWHALR